MVDIVSSKTRSKMMSAIKSKNTKPELIIRRGLFKMGFRFRLHNKMLPGSPDLVFKKHRTVLFVNGCFWHGHNCKLFKIPSTNTIFWQQKISKNKLNDFKNKQLLLDLGWNVIIVWECSIKYNNSNMFYLFDILADRIKYMPQNSYFELTASQFTYPKEIRYDQ